MTGDEKDKAACVPRDRRLLERALRDMAAILQQSSKAELRQMLREMRGTAWPRLEVVYEAPRPPDKRTHH